MTLAFVIKIWLRSRPINVSAYKINSLPLRSYGRIMTIFLQQDNPKKIWSFKKTFLLINISIEVILEMLFLSLSNANIELIKLKKITWRSYNIVEVLYITSKIELISKNKFARAILDKNSGTFMVHITTLKAMLIYLSKVS